MMVQNTVKDVKTEEKRDSPKTEEGGKEEDYSSPCRGTWEREREYTSSNTARGREGTEFE